MAIEPELSGNSIQVEVSPSRLEAFVTVTLIKEVDLRNERFLEDLILTTLHDHHVIHGIDRPAISALIRNRLWGRPVLVAKGTERQAGIDGRVEFFFETDKHPKPRQLQDGKVDFREIGIIHVVNQDDLLARIIPPQEGVPGRTVEGAVLPVQRVQSASVEAGLNTYFSDPGKLELRAFAAGSVSLKRGVVQLESTLTIPGHVDFTTGNVNFTGDVIVGGDVKSGFRVVAKGDVEIHGIVEDAYVEAGGNVLIKGGVEGSGKGLIRAGGTVHLKFIENQKVEAAGSVHIAGMALHARVFSDDSIYLTLGRGIAIGGHLKARLGITAKIIGSAHHAATLVEVAPIAASPDDLKKRSEEIAAIKSEIAETGAALQTIQNLKVSHKAAHAGIDMKLRRLATKWSDLKNKLDKKEQELQELERQIERARTECMVMVMNQIYPGTVVIVGPDRHVINEIRGQTTFKLLAQETPELEDAGA